MRQFVIIDPSTQLLWTKENGWGSGTADVFTLTERQQFSLPLGGAWAEISAPLSETPCVDDPAIQITWSYGDLQSLTKLGDEEIIAFVQEHKTKLTGRFTDYMVSYGWDTLVFLLLTEGLPPDKLASQSEDE